MVKSAGVTDENGEAHLDMPPGVYTLRTESEGFEPVEQPIEVKSEPEAFHVELKDITKGYITLTNDRLRGIIRSSTSLQEIAKYVKESEHIIDLAAFPSLKKDATKGFKKTSELASKRIEQLRRMESFTSFNIGPTGIKFTRAEKKSDANNGNQD